MPSSYTPPVFLGPFDYGHGHLTQMVEDYLNGRLKACVRGGYDFVDVRDVADGIIAAAEKGKERRLLYSIQSLYASRGSIVPGA